MAKKVELITQSYIELSDVQEQLDQKHHQNYLYDYNNTSAHFYEWCDAKGYGQEDPEGKRRGASQLWHADYEKDPRGMPSKPESLDFFKYLSTTYIIDGHTVFLEIDDKFIHEYGHPEWVCTILKEIVSSFTALFPSGTVVIKII
jgi:hypothetical protein